MTHILGKINMTSLAFSLSLRVIVLILMTCVLVVSLVIAANPSPAVTLRTVHIPIVINHTLLGTYGLGGYIMTLGGTVQRLIIRQKGEATCSQENKDYFLE